jgi:uncharacterized protein (DUF58 family)
MITEQIKESFIRWAIRKQPRASSSITLTRGRIFILPTRYGLMYALMLITMLMGAIHYSNNMAFLLTFLLAGMGSMAMWQTHRNLLGLTLEKLPAPPVFVGENARLPLKITNTSSEGRYGLTFQQNDAPLSLYECAAHKSNEAQLLIPARQRGWLQPGRFRIYTRFPLGLFQAWSWLEYDWSTLSYPRPINNPLPVNQLGTEGGDGGKEQTGTEDFSGLREYRPGDSSRHIAWKAMAHTEHPMTKQFSASSKNDLWLNWDDVDEPNDELRLSKLTYQVIEADRLNLEYGLRLPTRTIAPGFGELHKQDCLKALALY